MMLLNIDVQDGNGVIQVAVSTLAEYERIKAYLKFAKGLSEYNEALAERNTELANRDIELSNALCELNLLSAGLEKDLHNNPDWPKEG